MINMTPMNEMTPHDARVKGKPMMVINQPNRAICGIANRVARVGNREYIEFLILFGMTSISTLCVRISANPPKKLVDTKVVNMSTMGTIFSTGSVKSSILEKGQ